MNVSLYAITSNPEQLVIKIARVSNPKNQDNPEIAKLVRYLLRHNHLSPFEHAFATFEIVTSRAIAAQLLRHRSFTFQEFSQRYSIAENIEPIELRAQATKNRQSSTKVIDNYSAIVDDVIHDSYTAYMRLLDLGIAKESARFVLPLATTTTLYMTGSLRSWITYLQLRTKEDVQKEHREIALAIQDILRGELPVIFTALDMIAEEQIRHAAMIQVLKDKGIDTPEKLLEALLEAPVTSQDGS